jgi:serine/threonine protein kinase
MGIHRYLGKQDDGLLLSEASHGDLQSYINAGNSPIEISKRLEWCHQVAEAVTFIHSHGVIHSDLRPENFLVHEAAQGSLELLLCDFGGAVCEELGLDGKQLPNDPFYDHTQELEITPALDIFSLGSIFYTILTGYWPYRDQTYFSEGDSYLDYVDKVEMFFRKMQYPDVTELVGGKVIMGCWTKKFTTAEQVLDALKTQMSTSGAQGSLYIYLVTQYCLNRGI